MKSRLICYSLKGKNAVERMKFQREMYGFKDLSNNGRYSYRRKGLMDSIPHKKILDSVIIVSPFDAKSVIRLLKKFRVKIYAFDVLRKIRV
ncbi:MAG TPA: hypothetical protein EYP30_01280 [Archaeoglobaceae archaeon]|nr:hypothetical protein [Archaeoglobaceae archaeon]